MLNHYKQKFIRSNMILVGIALLIMLTAIFLYFCHTNLSDLKATMSQLTEPFGTNRGSADIPGALLLPGDPEPGRQPADGEAPESGKESSGPPAPKSRQEKHISVFFYDPDSEELSLLSKPLLSDENALRAAAKTIAASPESFGKLLKENLYFYKKYTGETVKIAIADIGFIRNSQVKMLLVLMLIFLGAMTFFYMISRWMAKLAMRPLEAALAMEKQFVTDTSHDLKTPLAVILANMSILRRAAGSSHTSAADMMQWIESTETAANNMQTLIEEMLTLSDIEAAEHKVHMQIVHVSDLAERTSLLMEPVAYEKKIAYETDLAEGIYIWGNEDYIKRIFQTLIENAAKYERPGGVIRISLSLQNGKALFRVTNQTTLIPEEELPYIFERFYRRDKSRHEGGHGLGLAIAKGMAERMGGSIEAASSEREGTTFCALFPIAPRT